MRQKHGYIRLDRNIKKWRWYKNGNTMRVFIHLLLSASWEDTDFEGETIHRGEAVVSRKGIAESLGISEKNVRTAIEHLISTNEVAKRSTPNYSVISILNYDLYQSDRPSNRPTTGQRPATLNKYNTEKNIYINTAPKKTRLVLREDPVTFATWFEEVPDDDE